MITDLAVLSLESELADGLNFETVIKKLDRKKSFGKFVCKFLIDF